MKTFPPENRLLPMTDAAIEYTCQTPQDFAGVWDNPAPESNPIPSHDEGSPYCRALTELQDNADRALAGELESYELADDARLIRILQDDPALVWGSDATIDAVDAYAVWLEAEAERAADSELAPLPYLPPMPCEGAA